MPLTPFNSSGDEMDDDDDDDNGDGDGDGDDDEMDYTIGNDETAAAHQNREA